MAFPSMPMPIMGQSLQIALIGTDATGIDASGRENSYGKNASRSFHCSACDHRVGRCSSGNHGEAPQRNGSFCRRRHRVRARIAVLTIGVRVLGTSMGAPLLGLSQCVGGQTPLSHMDFRYLASRGLLDLRNWNTYDVEPITVSG